MRGRRKDLPPLEFLVAFEAAARLGSFTGAAEELNLTQAAVSRQIRLLERNLGRSLFTRAHRAVRLTPEGRDFQHTVSLALSHIANAAQGLRVVDGNAKLTVAADQSVAALWLLPRLESFQREHGDISVRLISSDVEVDCLAEEVGDLLDRVLIDLDDDHWNWINWRVWLTEQAVELPLGKPGDLPSGLRRLVINSYPLIVQAARDGLGIALGWKHLVDEPLAAGALVRPLQQMVRTEFGYYLLMRHDRAASPQARAFRDWLRGPPAPD
jgi:DNA-binding transcriptional LysR family regulator